MCVCVGENAEEGGGRGRWKERVPPGGGYSVSYILILQRSLALSGAALWMPFFIYILKKRKRGETCRSIYIYLKGQAMEKA